MRYLSFIYSIVIVCTLVLLASCDKDPCEDLACDTVGGNCVNGICQCNENYEGLDCSSLLRDKFLGTYLVTPTCGGTADNPYTVTITGSGASLSKILIENFGNTPCGATISATVDNNFISVDDDGGVCVTADEEYRIEGTGQMSSADSSFTVSYVVTHAFFGTELSTSCTATLVRQ